MIARSGQNPIAPINILGDFAAGSLMCVLGILLALHSRQSTGQGQVIDASIADGAAYLMTWIFNVSPIVSPGQIKTAGKKDTVLE